MFCSWLKQQREGLGLMIFWDNSLCLKNTADCFLYFSSRRRQLNPSTNPIGTLENRVERQSLYLITLSAIRRCK